MNYPNITHQNLKNPIQFPFDIQAQESDSHVTGNYDANYDFQQKDKKKSGFYKVGLRQTSYVRDQALCSPLSCPIPSLNQTLTRSQGRSFLGISNTNSVRKT